MTAPTAPDAATLDEMFKAGCPDPTKCDEITVCDLCGNFVCRDHTDDVITTCDELVIHHDECVDQCNACAAAWAEDAAVDAAIERWREERS